MNRLYAPDRHERQTDITDAPQHAMQRGLIDHLALEDRCFVALVGDGQPIEPGDASVI
jgi:hypothetical protein